jgi:3-oxoadipate CoA-transferase beta subunit
MIGISRETMAWRAAQDLDDGSYVNLGIGLPTLAARFVPNDREIVYHSENGILGIGPPPAPGFEDPDQVNAGKEAVTLIAGASIFDHATSFMMIRGGHIDVALLGAYQVGENGDLANWVTAGDRKPPAVGGAMDLAVGARSVRVIMEHVMKDGAPRLLERCTYPLTAAGIVKRIYTNLAVVDVINDAGFVVVEIAAGVSRELLQSCTGAKLHFSSMITELKEPAEA